jgi:hypothetical protein
MCVCIKLFLLTLIVTKYQVTVRCNKMEIDVTAEDEDRFRRRDILKCFGVTVGMVRAIAFVLQIINSVLPISLSRLAKIVKLTIFTC